MHFVKALLLIISVVLFRDTSEAIVIHNDGYFKYSWESRSGLSEMKSDMSATTVGDLIFITGGCIKNQVYTPNTQWYGCGGPDYTLPFLSSKLEVFSPKFNKYDSTFPSMLRTRYRHATAALSSKLYIIGGRDEFEQIITKVDVLDTLNKTWSTFEFPEASSDHAAFTLGDKVYVVGGYSSSYEPLDTVYVLDEGAKKFIKSNLRLKKARGDISAAVAGNMAYVFGGYDSTFQSPLTSTEIFIQTPGGLSNWMEDDKTHVPRADCAVSTIGNRLILIGGESKDVSTGQPTLIRTVSIYDQSHSIWYNQGSIPSFRFRFAAATWNNSIFIFGGQYGLKGKYNEVGSYYPVSKTVNEIRVMKNTCI